MFGDLFCHGNSKAIPPSHPWIKQFMNDIREMAAIEGADDIAEQILNKPIELFTNSELAPRFCNVDISYIRAAFLSRHIPYARSQQHDVQSGLNSAGIDGMLVCTVMGNDGSGICGKNFHTLHGLWAHRVQSSNEGHGHLLVDALTVTTQCPWCSIFCQHFHCQSSCHQIFRASMLPYGSSKGHCSCP